MTTRVLHSTYTLNLSGMHFRVPVGVSGDERAVGSNIEVGIKATVIASTEAFVNDNVTSVPDYAVIYRRIEQNVCQPAMLLEHVAYEVAHSVLDTSQMIVDVEVSVTKINPPVGADGLKATVVLTLSRT